MWSFSVAAPTQGPSNPFQRFYSMPPPLRIFTIPLLGTEPPHQNIYHLASAKIAFTYPRLLQCPEACLLSFVRVTPITFPANSLWPRTRGGARPKRAPYLPQTQPAGR